MSILQAENITKSFGEKVLFENLTFAVSEGSKVAIIAKNGTGKTTLLKILARKEDADSGQITQTNDTTLAYLEQDTIFPENLTLPEYIAENSGRISNVIKEYDDAMEAFTGNSSDQNNNRLQDAIEGMDHFDAWTFDTRIKEVLGKLKLQDVNKPLAQLSGGQRKRAALACAIISTPDILLLDEPTNHLDVDMIEWIEDYLSRAKLTLIVITHDRYFLDNVCNEIFEIDNNQIYNYKGNYSYFLEKKAEREYNQDMETSKARNLLTKELEWMRRQPKARTTKSKARIDAFYTIEEKANKQTSSSNISLDVNMQRLGNKIIEMHKVCFHWDKKPMLDHFSYTFKRGEKLGVVGVNGTGKSTFLDILTGKLTPESGRIETGETIRLGYYRQQGMQLTPGKRVIDIVTEIAETVTLTNGSSVSASQLLNRFLFPPATQYGLVEKLSGGEKRRLYLLTVLIQNPNFLILDEPTNDLDIQTLTILEDFLSDFSGCLVIVSHDRFFLDRLADQILVFEGNGKIKGFTGRYSELREIQKQEKRDEQQQSQQSRPVEKPVIKETPTDKPKKLSYKEQKELEQIEIDIENLEKEKEELTSKLAAPDAPYDEIVKWSSRLEEINKLMEAKSDRWLVLSEMEG